MNPSQSSRNLSYWCRTAVRQTVIFYRQISIYRTESIFVVRILLSMLRFTGYLSDRLKVFAGQNEKMPGGRALFTKTAIHPFINKSACIKCLWDSYCNENEIFLFALTFPTHAPSTDPEMTVTHYTRTKQQNEVLGLAVSSIVSVSRDSTSIFSLLHPVRGCHFIHVIISPATFWIFIHLSVHQLTFASKFCIKLVCFSLIYFWKFLVYYWISVN